MKEEIICPHCEAEFYVETDDDVFFCVSCGEDLDDSDDPLYDEDELED